MFLPCCISIVLLQSEQDIETWLIYKHYKAPSYIYDNRFQAVSHLLISQTPINFTT